MKKIFLGLLFASLPAFAGDWELVAENEKGAVYVSDDPIGTDLLNRKTIWVMFENGNQKLEFNTVKMLKTIDCESRQTGTTAFKGYDKKGNLKDEFSVKPLLTQMETPDPDGFDAELLRSLCETTDEYENL